ncbi:MAG: LemA family protein [Verrucomicrobiota bacterium]|nr:LemA family protein [Verrucomicrobiota bacterium]
MYLPILAELTLWISIGVVVIILLGVIAIYNSLVALRNKFKNAFAQIDVQLKRRYDLIPNLVETVKGYMAHERETLDAVIQARSNATSARESAAANPGDPQSMGALMAAEEGLGGALGKLFALSEGYPDLKANQNVSSLMEELKTTENKIAFARQHFNDSVMTYNNKREMFPSSIIAGMFNFSEASMFEIGAAEREEVTKPVKVEF